MRKTSDGGCPAVGQKPAQCEADCEKRLGHLWDRDGRQRITLNQLVVRSRREREHVHLPRHHNLRTDIAEMCASEVLTAEGWLATLEVRGTAWQNHLWDAAILAVHGRHLQNPVSSPATVQAHGGLVRGTYSPSTPRPGPVFDRPVEGLKAVGSWSIQVVVDPRGGWGRWWSSSWSIRWSGVRTHPPRSRRGCSRQGGGSGSR